MHWWNTVARQFHRKPEWIAAIVKKSIGRRSWLVEVNGGTERDTACLDGTKSYSKHTEPRVTHACRPSIPAYSQLQGCAPPLPPHTFYVCCRTTLDTARPGTDWLPGWWHPRTDCLSFVLLSPFMAHNVLESQRSDHLDRAARQMPFLKVINSVPCYVCLLFRLP